MSGIRKSFWRAYIWQTPDNWKSLSQFDQLLFGQMSDTARFGQQDTRFNADANASASWLGSAGAFMKWPT